MPQIGAKYFDEDTNDSSDDCKGGNSTFAYWDGVFNSIGGIVAFLFEAYLGKLSDVYGRKKIMYITWFCSFISPAVMIFTNNVWYYEALTPLFGLTGTFGGSPTVLTAAIVDTIPCKENRIKILAMCFGIAGIIVVIAAIITPIITAQFGLHIAFWIFTVVMLLDLLFLIFFVEETLPPQKRVTSSSSSSSTSSTSRVLFYENPFRIFKEIFHSKLIMWFSVITLITAIPESGVDDMMTNYCDEQLDVCNSNTLTEYNALFTGSMGVAMLISQLGVLPWLTKYVTDVGLFIIGLTSVMIFMIAAALLYFIPNVVIGVIIWCGFGVSYLLAPIVDGALSKRLKDEEQGLGIGVVHGVKGITFGFSPYLFGGLYKLFDNDSWLVIIPWIFGAVINGIGYIIVLGPLRKIMNKYDEKEIKGGKVPVTQFESPPNDVIIN